MPTSCISRVLTSYLMSIDGLVSEGEFLEITEIKRQQAEDYECITNNGVAPPDQRKVKVTVNCKYISLCHTNSPIVTNIHLISSNASTENTANALLCINSNILILFPPGVFQPCGLIQADLSQFLSEGRCLLIAEFPLVFLPFPHGFVCQTLPWLQTWRTCQPIWVRQPSCAVKPWQSHQPPLSGTEMTTGEFTDEFSVNLFVHTHKPAKFPHGLH